MTTMDRLEFIGKLNSIYAGESNAIDEIVSEYDRLNNIIDKAIEYFKYQLEQLDFYKDTKARMLCAMGIVLLQGENNER